MKLETFTQNTRDHRLAEIVIYTRRRRIRLCVIYGMPAGGHMGFWRTRVDDLKGWNFRVGKRYVKALTLLLHTRPILKKVN